MMKKSMIKKSALALSLLGVGAFAVSGFSPTLKAAEEALLENKRPRKVMQTMLRNRLNFRAEHPLSEQQKQQIKEIVSTHRTEIQEQVKNSRDARVSFQEAAKADPDSAATEAAAEKIASTTKDRLLLRAKIRAKVWPILTEEQQAFLDEARADVLSSVDEMIGSFN